MAPRDTSNTPRARHSGITRASPPSACAGCSCGTRPGRQEPQALLCTDPAWKPAAILTGYRQRWQVEVTFQEVRTHLGVGDPAPVVRGGHRPHHPGPARPLPRAHPGRPPPAPPPAPTPPAGRLVPQAAPDFRRCPGLRAPPPLDGGDPFWAVPGHPRQPKTPPTAAGPAPGHSLLLGLKSPGQPGRPSDFVQSPA